VQVVYLKGTFGETGFSLLIGARVETRRLSAVGQGGSTCTAPPRPLEMRIIQLVSLSRR
jgi:hypothetical protein